MAVNKDLLNRELHTPEKLEILKAYALDKSQRSLVVAKIEKPAHNDSVDGADTTASHASGTNSDASSSMRLDGNIEITLSKVVEYLGPNAQTIAFLKREDHAKLDLASGMDLEKVLDVGIASQDTSG